MTPPVAHLPIEDGRGRPGYRLRSELARASLGPGPDGTGSRWLTWLNTLCLLFLVVGLAGRKSPGRVGGPEADPRRETLLPVIFQPPTPRAPTPAQAASGTVPTASAAVAPRVSDPPLVVPAVAAVGIEFPVLVEAAATPTLDPLLATPPVRAAVTGAGEDGPAAPAVSDPGPGEPGTGPAVFIPGSGTGAGGVYPPPAYPREARLRREQGEVRLRVRVLADGRPGEVVVESGSGSGVLDRAAVAQVRRFWRWPAGGLREYIVPLEFRLE